MEECSTTIELHDLVRVIGGNPREVFTVVGIGPGAFFTLQLGTDAATQRPVDASELELVKKAEKPEVEPGFVPGYSIMGY
jgi:hypothetical protein